MVNLESTIPSTLAILITDIVLLVTMLIGLFRMRVKGAGGLNVAQFLWKQVRTFSLSVIIPNSPM